MKTLPIALLPAVWDWQQLYHGKGMTGWEHARPGSFLVEEGVLLTRHSRLHPWYGVQDGEDITGFFSNQNFPPRVHALAATGIGLPNRYGRSSVFWKKVCKAVAVASLR